MSIFKRYVWQSQQQPQDVGANEKEYALRRLGAAPHRWLPSDTQRILEQQDRAWDEPRLAAELGSGSNDGPDAVIDSLLTESWRARLIADARDYGEIDRAAKKVWSQWRKRLVEFTSDFIHLLPRIVTFVAEIAADNESTHQGEAKTILSRLGSFELGASVLQRAAALLDRNVKPAAASSLLRLLQEAASLSERNAIEKCMHLGRENDALTSALRSSERDLQLEIWMHAACLSIATGAPGWEKPLSPDSLAMRAVRDLRKERDKLAADLREARRVR